ncbi:ribose-5-phosphate isomerase RpiA [Salinibacter altiplanensis]|uniref:ribose-5-phosphate isomerase RpiA n=1 Tax=Salinibacter altiplanensis TaxID=1803181 RepID=UPI000C9FBB43|nr:ribose-5-phosphate isomerase RpiA [Salinibacter altiplanensis]
MDRDSAKQAAAEAAVQLVSDGMCVGLGSGSTTAYALEFLGRRIQDEALNVRGVPTSFATERRARAHGIPLASLDDDPALDLALDGADEVDSDFRLIKGGGGAHAREKVVAHQADRFVVLVDPTKEVHRLGTGFPVPVEVLPMAATPVMNTLEAAGATPTLRTAEAKDGPVVTDQGLWIIDAQFPDGIDAPAELSRRLCSRPGVLDHGLFLEMATDVLVGHPDGSVDHHSAS